ncbi:hypothetical protein JCM10207_001240 [Rhodosporidiobolus poonsookiae]
MFNSPDLENSKPTPLFSRPPTRALPVELWLPIFRDNKLAYGNYKSLQRSHSFDNRLFRSPPPAQPVEPGYKVAFHPVFDIADLICFSPKNVYSFLAKQSHDSCNIDFVRDFPCTTEYATLPAGRIVTMKMGNGVKVARQEGVRVCDVVEAVAELWRICEDLAQVHSWGPQTDTSDICWMDTLFDQCFWEGLRSATVVKTDKVLLRKCGFGR